VQLHPSRARTGLQAEDSVEDGQV